MLVCPVCQLEYTIEGERQPRLLATCGHTFCRKCLDSHSSSDRLSCPQCLVPSTDPHVPNITIMGYVESQAVSTQPPPIMHAVPAPVKALCQDCKRSIATIICFQCLPSGFKFCESCSSREHNRSFGPVQGHNPKSIQNVKFSTPVPGCKIHTKQPCIYFSFKMNSFACEECKNVCNFIEDEYISIEVALSQIREDVPSLIELLRERVDIMSSTRAQLDKLLGRVDQEKKRSIERVQIEFNQFEMALKKRMTDILANIEEEAKFQSKTLLEQQERLEIAQGNADTAIVRANWLMQMSDYSYIHQAESVINSMKTQLSDEEFPMYHTVATTGEIPMYLCPDFIKRIDTLGTVGGGRMPSRLKSLTRNGLLYLSWEQSDVEVEGYEITYQPFEEKDADPVAVITNDYKKKYPFFLKMKGDCTEKLIDGIVIGTNYMFRVRAINVAGWGVWSHPIIGKLGGFPLEIGYTGEIVEIEIPLDGLYSIIAYGAKACDGATKKGGKGAIVGAKFQLKKLDTLIILCGGMSTRVVSSTGGAGGTFVALSRRRDVLLVAGGGGGTRGYDEEDLDGTDANLSESGCDGIGHAWAQGGAGGGAGKDACFSGPSPSWGHGGAGLTTASTTAQSFLHGGAAEEGGGFGGGGGVGQYGGGGGGGYSGGGGGRGGGGGGSFIDTKGIEPIKNVGNMGHGLVKIDRMM